MDSENKVEEENVQAENQEEVQNEEKAVEENQENQEENNNEVKEEEQVKAEEQPKEEEQVKEEEKPKEEEQVEQVQQEEQVKEEEQVKQEEQPKEEEQVEQVKQEEQAKEEEVKPEEEQPKQESYPEEKLEIEEVKEIKEAPKEETKEFEPKKETSEMFLDYGLKVKAQWYNENNKNDESDTIDIVFSTESKNKLVLHWGVFKDNQNDKCWYHPDKSCYPPLTTEYDNYALETDFSYLEDDQKEQKIHMRFPKGNGSPKNDLDSLNFVFFEKDNNKWHNNNWQDYHIKLN
jgi:hypothetical protein